VKFFVEGRRRRRGMEKGKKGRGKRRGARTRCLPSTRMGLCSQIVTEGEKRGKREGGRGRANGTSARFSVASYFQLQGEEKEKGKEEGLGGGGGDPM